MRRRGRKERLRHHQLQRQRFTPTNQGWESIDRAYENLSNQSSNTLIDTNGADRSFRREGEMSSRLTRHWETILRQTRVDLRRLNQETLGKNETEKGGEATPRHSQGKRSQPPEPPGGRRPRTDLQTEACSTTWNCEIIGPEIRVFTFVHHRLQAEEARPRRFRSPETGHRARRTFNTRREKNRTQSILWSLQVHRWESENGVLEPSHGAGRSRTPERQADQRRWKKVWLGLGEKLGQV